MDDGVLLNHVGFYEAHTTSEVSEDKSAFESLAVVRDGEVNPRTRRQKTIQITD